ncbi:MAG: hypothetical protein P4L46_10625 [Fimbriimonas sp.]|nr:hypothetical protein [Fimbriimonas sp.]
MRNFYFFIQLRTAICLTVASLAVCSFAAGSGSQSLDQIGMFDLKAIRQVPLDVETLSKTKQGDVTIEEVRYTSLPGVRIYAILTYKESLKAAPGYMVVERFRVKPLVAEAKNGFFGIAVAPPTGNTDPTKHDSVGGPKYKQPFSINQQFLEDKNESYIYQYTVALLRMLDYLSTRSEVNLATTMVSGYSWAGTMVGLLHALDDRPNCYFIYHGLGYHTDENGLSGGVPAVMSRKLYEMYCPAAYAQYGTKPLWVGVALDDYYTKIDSIMETYDHLKCEKVFVYVPNRHHTETARHEFKGYVNWESHWQFGLDKPSSISDGTVKASNGKLVYTCSIDAKDAIVHSEIFVSYGKAGDWMGRTWHRFALVKRGDGYEAEIPVYSPSVPLYVVAQIETEKFGTVGNGIQYVEPTALGIAALNAAYPSALFDPSLKDDLYIRTGDITWSDDGPEGKGSAIVSPGQEGTITFQNIDGDLWEGKQVLDIWLKGDGQPGPIRAYFASHPNYYVEIGKGNTTEIDLVPTGFKFANGWKEYAIPLRTIKNLSQVSTLFLDANKRNLQIGPITLR